VHLRDHTLGPRRALMGQLGRRRRVLLGMAGAIRDVLHAHRHLLDRGCDGSGRVGLHSRRLGHHPRDLRDVPHGIGQPPRTLADFAHHGAQLAKHGRQRTKQAVCARAIGDPDIELTRSGLAHDLVGIGRLAAERTDHAPHHPPRDEAEDDEHRQHEDTEAGRRATYGGIDIIDIHARTDDPVPLREHLDVGQLGLGRVRPRARPQVIHETGAIGTRHAHELAEQVLALRIAVLRKIR
ncbi:hypothetical protein RZS08_11940, partial [Arthrospira platensis SPKY1]|nr:hypothetical protein [Arthrospira platensis SPKY1]